MTATRGQIRSAQCDELVQRGLRLHQAGKLAEASALYEQALGRVPHHAEANHLLGVVRLAQERLDEALSHIAKAIQANPKNHQYLGNMGVALNAARQHERAVEALSRAIALKPDFAEAYSNRGMALRALGQYDDAVRSYEEAIRLKPREPGFYVNLANALDDAGRPHEALDALDTALRLNPRHAKAQAGRISVLQALRRFDEALSAAEVSVAALPGNVDVLKAYGELLEKMGRVEEALHTYARVLELDPTSGTSHYHISYRTYHRERDASFVAMRRVFEDTALAPGNRSLAGHALGKALSDIGEHAESRDVFTQANALHRLDQPYSLSDALTQMAAISRDFAEVPDRLLGAGFGDAAPIFIVGLPRAGKTTIEMVLGQSPSAWAGGELGQLRRVILDLPVKSGHSELRPLSRRRLAAIDASQLADAGREYVDYVARLAPPGRVTIDTMPPNFLFLGYLRLMLPNARIIHAVRDPLDHAVALFEKYFGRSSYGYTNVPGDLVAYYGAYRRMMDLWKQQAPWSLLEVDVSRLREDSSLIRQLYAFCGLEPPAHEPAVPESEPQAGKDTGQAQAERERHLDAYKDWSASLKP